MPSVAGSRSHLFQVEREACFWFACFRLAFLLDSIDWESLPSLGLVANIQSQDKLDQACLRIIVLEALKYEGLNFSSNLLRTATASKSILTAQRFACHATLFRILFGVAHMKAPTLLLVRSESC